jgi:hypothetical protein
MNVFTIKSLRITLNIINASKVTSVAELKKIIDAEIKRQKNEMFAGLPKITAPKNPRIEKICPSCKLGKFRPVEPVDGVNRVGCCRCHYSEVVK